MTRDISVLQRFRPRHLHLEPFPYIMIEDALPQDLYDQLAAQYPESSLGGHTHGFSDFRYYQKDFTDEHVTPLWREFVAFHSSRAFKDQVMRAIEPGMRHLYPEITDKYLTVDTILRHTGKPRGVAAMEVQFVMNSADVEKIRTPHLDQGRELFACLFYMKRPDDMSTGGDLYLYEKTTPDFEFRSGRLAPEDQIRPVTSMPYRANNLVIFLNSTNSIHGVGPRTKAQVIRRYVNITCHIREKLFLLDKTHEE